MNLKSLARPLLPLLLVTLLASGMSAVWAAEAAQEILAVKPAEQTAAWAKSWWMPRHEQKLAELKKLKQVDLVMIGDSITHGWENASGREVWEKFYAGRNALNLGFSGDRTEHVLWRFEHGAIDGISPKLAVVMIGTNNAGHRQEDSKHTAAGVKAIVEQLRKRLPETKILLLAVFPRGPHSDDKLRKLNVATNKIIAGYADKKHVFYLDIGDAFLDDDGRLPKAVMPDFLHPNAKGYALWADAMEPTVKKLMGEK